VFIHEMNESECRQALEEARMGRLACARDNQPYLVPIYFALDRDDIYAFTTLGQKIEWMRTNPLVCLEVDERIAHERWHSVIVFGHYEELPDLPEYQAARVKALEVLQKHAMWWQPAYIGASHRQTPHSDTPIFYRIKIHHMTGHRATPDTGDESTSDEEHTEVKNSGWLRILRNLGLHD